MSLTHVIQLHLLRLCVVLLFVSLSSLSITKAELIDGGERSGGFVIDPKLGMSPVEAYLSNHFEKRFRSEFMPNIASKVSGEKLCKENGMVYILEEMEYCSLWEARLFKPENNSLVAYYKYKHQALGKARSRNGGNVHRCVQRTQNIPSLPSREKIADCLSWSLQFSKDGPRRFKSYQDAMAFKATASSSTGDPICEIWGEKIQDAPTSIGVTFLENSKPLAFYRFKLPDCRDLKSRAKEK